MEKLRKEGKAEGKGLVLVGSHARGQETAVWAGAGKERPQGKPAQGGTAHLLTPHSGSLAANPAHRLLQYMSIPKNQIVWLSLKLYSEVFLLAPTSAFRWPASIVWLGI